MVTALAQVRATKLYHTPSGLSTHRPAELPALNRAAILRGAHGIAVRALPFMNDYREAFAYGLKAAWQAAEVARSIAALKAQVKPRTLSADQERASREATRRCGASFT